MKYLVLMLAMLIGSPSYADSSLDVYQGVVLTVNVDDPDEVNSYLWFVFSPNRDIVPVRTEDGGRVARFGQNSLKQEGDYLVWIIVVYKNADSDQLVGHFQVGPQPDPDPSPDPGPDPSPDPDPDPGPDPDPDPDIDWQVAIFVETNDYDGMPIKQLELVTGLVFRKELETEGHYFVGVFDVDSFTEVSLGADCKTGNCDVNGNPLAVPSKLKPFWDEANGKPIPRVVIAPKAGGTPIGFNLPADKAAFYEKLRDPE